MLLTYPGGISEFPSFPVTLSNIEFALGCVVLRDVAIPQTDQVHGQNWRDSESGCPSSSFHIISQHVLLPPASTDTIHSQSWRPPTLVKLRLGWHRASRDVNCCRCLRWRPSKTTPAPPRYSAAPLNGACARWNGIAARGK